VGVGAALVVSNCATSPSAALKTSYDSLGAVVKLTTTLLQTHQITKAQAQHVDTLAKEAKLMLDETQGLLVQCASTPIVPAPSGTSAITPVPVSAPVSGGCGSASIEQDLQLAADVLTKLQVYLAAQQKGAK
jgi:hypothetical protein